MGSLAHALRVAVDVLVGLFDGLTPLWSLTAVSALTAVAVLGVVRVTTPARWIENARSQIAACIYEVRLFLDSPVRVLKSQGRMLKYSGIYLLALTPAMVAMTIPMGILYLQLDLRHGWQPLRAGEAVVVRIGTEGIDPRSVTLDAGTAGEVTAPPVVDERTGHVYYRVRITEVGHADLTITTEGGEVKKHVVTDPNATVLSPNRVSGTAMWWAETGEPPLPDGPGVTEISVPHETRSTPVFGMTWWLYWLLASTVLAMVLRKPLGVTL